MDELGKKEKLTGVVAGRGGITLIQRLLGRSLTLAFQVLLSRGLGLELYGAFAIGQSILRIAHSLSSVGPMNAMIRYVSSFSSGRDWAKAKGYAVDSLLLSVGIGGLTAIGFVVFLQIAGQRMFGDARVSVAILGLIVSLPAYNALLLVSAAGRALGFVSLGVFVYDLLRPFLVLAVVGCAFVFRASLKGAVLGFSVATYLAIIVAVFLLLGKAPARFLKARGKHAIGEVSRFSFFASMAGIGFIVLSRVDRIMLGALAGVSDTGVYAAASLVAFQVTIVMKALEAVFAPQIARLHSLNRKVELSELYTTTTKWVFTITVPVMLPLLLFGGTFLAIFGKGFSAGAPALAVLAGGQFVRASIGCSEQIFLMTGHQKIEAWNSIVLVSVDVILNAWLIPKHGVMGAAVATAAALGLMTVLRFLEARWLLNLNPLRIVLWKPLVAGGFSAAAGFLVGMLGLRPMVELVVGAAAIIVVYLISLVTLGLDREYRELLRVIGCRIRHAILR